MKKIKRGLLLLSISFYLQSCYHIMGPFYYVFKDAALYSEFSEDDMVKALKEISVVQTEEYIEQGKVFSPFELNVECYEAYSIISNTQANVVMNVAKQEWCGDIRVFQYVHTIFLPRDSETENEVIEVLCVTVSYLDSEIDDVAMKVKWDGEKPICPDDMFGDTVKPEYRRYPIGSDPSLRPEFKRWKWFTPKNTFDGQNFD